MIGTALEKGHRTGISTRTKAERLLELYKEAENIDELMEKCLCLNWPVTSSVARAAVRLAMEEIMKKRKEEKGDDYAGIEQLPEQDKSEIGIDKISFGSEKGKIEKEEQEEEWEKRMEEEGESSVMASDPGRVVAAALSNGLDVPFPEEDSPLVMGLGELLMMLRFKELEKMIAAVSELPVEEWPCCIYKEMDVAYIEKEGMNENEKVDNDDMQIIDYSLNLDHIQDLIHFLIKIEEAERMGVFKECISEIRRNLEKTYEDQQVAIVDFILKKAKETPESCVRDVFNDIGDLCDSQTLNILLRCSDALGTGNQKHEKEGGRVILELVEKIADYHADNISKASVYLRR
ncbi:MAG: hypothetical protein QW728_07100 [Thermoplasmata archaeon]